jgi:hypothetical protein
MRTTGFPETSIINYQSTLRNILEEQRSNLHFGGSWKSRKAEVPVLVMRAYWGSRCRAPPFLNLGRRYSWPGHLILILIYLLIEIGLTPSGSSTVHIYIQKIYRTTQLITLVRRLSGIRGQTGQTNWEGCGPCPAFASYTLAFALQPKKRLGKPPVRVAEECQLARWEQNIPVFLNRRAARICHFSFLSIFYE